MIRKTAFALIMGLGLAANAQAEIFEVEMLNKGDAGIMVFQPDFLRIAPGDTVKFIATDRAHSAESDANLWPETVTPFAGKVNEEIDYTFETEGFYGVKCKPHYAMGMVMTVVVGDAAEAPEGWLEGRIPRKAKERYDTQLTHLTD